MGWEMEVATTPPLPTTLATLPLLTPTPAPLQSTLLPPPTRPRPPPTELLPTSRSTPLLPMSLPATRPLLPLTELPPLFIAVFAAIIIAQLVAPLFGALFGAKVALFGGIFNPLGQLKFDAINAILNPFGFSFASCDGTTGRVCTTINAQFMGRSFSDIGILDMIDAANSLYNAAY